ncbi:hypothetical protein PR001_g29058 [Phytophthora rubi]|uniref:SUEL-type lectin domain-containing protein n=1 Tax=Phytophthora rubi TaxID=129364 RepID=A0A6A3H5Q3_9STRA|nr:hypothetical protein PR002_g29720 [Phytophthora rubi]KAE8964435.1 hypothetical protein PR001_g29058 [Phytophthora rubi]
MQRVRSLALSCTILLGLVVKPSVVHCSDVGSNSDFLDAGSASVANNNRVKVFTGHDGSECSNASSVVIQEGGCDETLQCTPFTVGAGTTYYGQGVCSDSRDAYLQSTFGDAGLFVVEYYEDAYCNKLYRSDVYLADSGCHYFTLGVMQIWTAEDKSMAALTVNSACDEIDWSVFMDLNVSVNTGTCIPDSGYNTEAVKYVLLGEPVYFDPFAAKLATDTNKSTTATITTTTTATPAPTGDTGTSTALSVFTMNSFLTLLLTSVAIAAAN